MLNKTYNRPATEFEIHSDCYQLLKQHYPLVRGEVKVAFERPKDENGKSLRDKYGKKIKAQRGARFDIVVFDSNNQAVFVVEVKRNEKRKNTKKAHYENIAGVNCHTVGSVEQCEELINWLKSSPPV